MEQTTIYLCYNTDNWHTHQSMTHDNLIYISDNLEDCITKLKKHFSLAEWQCQQLRNIQQTQASGEDDKSQLIGNIYIAKEILNDFTY